MVLQTEFTISHTIVDFNWILGNILASILKVIMMVVAQDNLIPTNKIFQQEVHKMF